MERIAEKQTEIHTQLSDAGSLKLEDLDPRVKDMYEGVRDVMKKYRSGKVPKAFKIIPKLRNWEQILFVTEPHAWSAAAMYQGTRIFSSILAQHMAQRFYNLVLLPRIRDDLGEYRKLNAHLYRAMQKSLFKPAAFMKGIILPLLEVSYAGILLLIESREVSIYSIQRLVIHFTLIHNNLAKLVHKSSQSKIISLFSKFKQNLKPIDLASF